jgi:D-xylose 1-dehydrogenase (NADP+, D-xylono-1,5-lactone-forming)
VKLGLLSTACINDAILRGASLTDAVEVVAVGRRDSARAKEYARDHGIPRAHGSYEDLLADPDVDAIYNSLPNALHVEWSIRALEAGKHVLCEKPLDRSPAEVERLFDVAARQGLVVMEAFMYRHHPQTQALRELVASGGIGELRQIRAVFSFMLTEPENVRLRPDLAGGALMDVGCYCVSGSRLLAGESDEALARQALEAAGLSP